MKAKFIHIAKTVFSATLWKEIFRQVYLFVGFFILLILFLLSKIFSHMLFMPIIGRILYKINFATGKTIPHYEQLLSNKIDGMRPSEVRRSYLIGLALKNLLAKKTRSFITMFGMAVGIGIIVFLISLGYGIERLVIGRIASLDELRMIDVSSSENTSLRLNKSIYDKIAALPKIEKVIPIVSIVGKISFGGAQTDVLVYAVPRSYLDAIKVQTKQGKLFTNNETFGGVKSAAEGAVAGASTSLKQGTLGAVQDAESYAFTILPQQSPLVAEHCDIAAKTLGYTTRIEGGFSGKLYWGSEYSPFDGFGRGGYDKNKELYLGAWVQGLFPLYSKNPDGTVTPLLDDLGRQSWKEGCIQEQFVQKEKIIKVTKPQVLGEATTSAELEPTPEAPTYEATIIASDSSGFEMVSLDASGSAGTSPKKSIEKLSFSSAPEGTAVVSTGLLTLLGIAERKAVGSSFKSSFIIGKSLLPSIEGKVQSEEKIYTIVGVIDDVNSTYFYIPYADIKRLNIPHVSQFKVVLKQADSLATSRKQIEAFGFRTNSTYDTVKQIESLFVSLRVILAVLGLVALGIAALGMFNTLTVSLLERTREIGGMKTMGMVSDEVQDLFIAEAMIMGLSGGIGGLTLGYLTGKGLSLIVSAIAISQGQGYIDLTYIPMSFTIFILITSFIVGVVTGLYPAQRAKNISALNALRYE